MFLHALLPESAVSLKARLSAESHGIVSESQKTLIFLRETRAMLKRHWMLFMLQLPLARLARSLPDRLIRSFPTGGAFTGWLSELWGRCIAIVVFTCLTAVFIPLTSFSALAAGAFCIQSHAIPIHLAARVLCNVPWCRLPARKHDLLRVRADRSDERPCRPTPRGRARLREPAHHRAHAGDARGLHLRCVPPARVLSHHRRHPRGHRRHPSASARRRAAHSCAPMRRTGTSRTPASWSTSRARTHVGFVGR
ncbi:hypothetical protein C8J57DRAFT_189253 [Mycena rebaudengoi]|nr:hypothetical protein C8J57DRAFT_189253 [Mycena rebaudengoi]